MASGYFPPGSLSHTSANEGPNDDWFSKHYDDWFSKHLRSMGEPPLWPAPDNQPLTFRFLALPTFDKPYAVRVERQGTGWLLTGKMTEGDGGYDEGPVLRSVSGRLSPAESHRLNKLIAKFEFWELPGVTNGTGCDGIQWVLEAAEAGRYHVAHRYCPVKCEFAKFCSYLGALGGFRALLQ